jgi:hypothetical protein
MRGIPPARIRYALAAAFLVLVLVGVWLANLDPVVNVAVIVATVVLLGFVEWTTAREAARAEALQVEATSEVELDGEAEEPAAEPGPEPEPEPEFKPEPEFAVSERSARAILASGPPPVPEPARSEPRIEPQVEHEQEPELEEPESEPEPEAAPEPLAKPREWSIWELQRLIRDQPDDPRQEEWAALVQSLRDFASVDGTLPVEFDPLVRDSFGVLLAAELETEVVAAP